MIHQNSHGLELWDLLRVMDSTRVVYDRSYLASVIAFASERSASIGGASRPSASGKRWQWIVDFHYGLSLCGMRDH